MVTVLRRFRPVVADYARDYGVALTVSGTLTVGAIVDSMLPWYLIVAFAIFAFGTIIWVLNQFYSYSDRFPLAPGDRELVKDITNSLLASGYTINEVQDPATVFTLHCVDRNDVAVTIAKTGNIIHLSFAFGIGGEVLGEWNALPEDKRDRILGAIALGLNSLQANFTTLTDPPVNFRIYERLPLEGRFNIRVFRTYLRRVGHSAYAVQIMLRRGILAAQEQVHEEAARAEIYHAVRALYSRFPD